MNSRTREGFYALWTLAILICLGVCVFLLIWVSFADGGDAAQTTPAQDSQTDAQTDVSAQPVLPGEDGTVPGQTDTAGSGTAATDDGSVQDAGEGNTSSVPVILGETADMGQDYQDQLTFLGDSTTYGLYAYGLLPHYQVWTPASGTLSLFNYAVETIDCYTPGGGDTAESLPIVDCAANYQPEYLVITLGVNGVSLLDEDQFKQYYTSLVQDILYASPDTRIICNSIYPVIDSQTPEGIKNDRINAANGWILDVATQQGVRYLNSHDALTDASGNLSTDYISTNSDGIHMDSRGYEAVLRYIRTHAWQ